MKIRKLLLFLATAALASCSPEEKTSLEDFMKEKQERQEQQENPGPEKTEEKDDGLADYTITATLVPYSPASDGIKTEWNKGDSIAVTDGVEIRKFVASSSGRTATFTGRAIPSATQLGAVYPYISSAIVHPDNNLVVKTDLTPVLVCTESLPEMPLAALFTAAKDGKCSLEMKPWLPAFSFSISPADDSKYSRVTITGNRGEGRLGGNVAINLSSGNVRGTSGVSPGFVTVHSAGKALASGKYTVCVYSLDNKDARTFANGFKFSFTGIDGSTAECKTGAVTLNQGVVTDLGTVSPAGTSSLGTVSGTVSFTDGSPAAGVSVSDGFRVVTTDRDGKYTLAVCSDTWYIYLSLPADAKISSATDFYKRYSPDVKTYDFTLEKQAVENEFRIMAIGDIHCRTSNPRWNYANFRDISIPGIKKVLSYYKDMPVYGLALGDVAFSNTGYNGNDVFPTMAALMKQMPVPTFQTIGNHDNLYYDEASPLTTDATSSTLDLKWQRTFEDTFGPVNYSFNRGDVHFVVMKDVQPVNTTQFKQEIGFSVQQVEWLRADLSNVGLDKKVILAVHIPYETGDKGLADVLCLLAPYRAEVFSAHMHYKDFTVSIGGTGICDHIHSALCAGWWAARVESDGLPMGVTMYTFRGDRIVDERFQGIVENMDSKDYQMRIYRGGLKYGGKYAYFQTSTGSDQIVINVFNADRRWGKVEVYENGKLSGEALPLTGKKMYWNDANPLVATTYTIPADNNQDWWSIGYEKGVLHMNLDTYPHCTDHMFIYTLKDPSAKVNVVATDPYGNKFSCSDIIESGTEYPSYLKL